MEPVFLIRSVREDDLEPLYRLSELVYFINLPSDKELLKEKIQTSIKSFGDEIEDKFEREYIFVMENLLDHTLVGSSMVIARHGSPTSPHMYFKLKEIQKYSESIHAGFIHKLLRLSFDYDGPTEIGGLVLVPELRKHRAKLGRQLSYARFLFIKMRRRWFKNYILSELMPPLTESGESVLWESLGRRFTNLSYQEADLLSRKNKEFVTSLFPRGDIYTCLLSGDARDAIGKVGAEAGPVKHMLENIGFRWREHIDPFDGGPHYWAETDKILPIRQAKKLVLQPEPLKRRQKEDMLIAISRGAEVLCVQSHAEIVRSRVSLPRSVHEALSLTEEDAVYTMPLELTS